MARKGRMRPWTLGAIAVAIVVVLSGAGCGVVQPGASSAVVSGAPPDVGLIEEFTTEGILWIRTERERHYPGALPISVRDRSWLSEFFPEDLLDRARVATVAGFENPEFFSLFEEYGEPRPFDLRQARGMALIDTILIARTASESSTRDRLLFHELVHLMQYEVLGLDVYMEGYVEGWAQSGRRYRGIPHEQQAFELSSRFWGSRSSGFSVEAEVRSRFGLDAVPSQQ